MSLVLADQAGLAVDWDWHHGLTVWTLVGPHYESRFAARVIEYQLPARPPTERRARRAARRWWRAGGRAQALDRAAALAHGEKPIGEDPDRGRARRA